MEPVLVFLGIATVVGCVFRAIAWWRLRAVAGRPDVSEDDLCQLRQANRITSKAVLASLAGLAAVGLAYAVL